VEGKVVASLPDYRVIQIERVENFSLWTAYTRFKEGLVQGHGSPNEREFLFHATSSEQLLRDVIAKCDKNKGGFDPKLGRGEYGNGCYFAEHAIYSVAYTQGWLFHGLNGRSCPVPEPGEGSELTLALVSVALGKCKDWGGRCLSERSLPTPITEVEWPYDREGTSQRMHGPPHGENDSRYDSVCGTEGDLGWVKQERFADRGKEFGKQYITFHEGQTYPSLLVTVQRKFRSVEEGQAAWNKHDERWNKEWSGAPNNEKHLVEHSMAWLHWQRADQVQTELERVSRSGDHTYLYGHRTVPLSWIFNFTTVCEHTTVVRHFGGKTYWLFSQ